MAILVVVSIHYHKSGISLTQHEHEANTLCKANKDFASIVQFRFCQNLLRVISVKRTLYKADTIFSKSNGVP